LTTVNPLNLEVALAIEREMETRFAEVDRLRRQVVQRVQQEADLARRRYLQVDPLCHLDRNVASDVAVP